MTERLRGIDHRLVVRYPESGPPPNGSPWFHTLTEAYEELSRARESLRGEVAALAVAGAEQILRREVDAKVHAQLLAGVRDQL